MEGAVCYSHVRLDIMAMAIFTVAVQERQGGDKVALPEEVVGVRQLEFLLRGYWETITYFWAIEAGGALIFLFIADPGLNMAFVWI